MPSAIALCRRRPVLQLLSPFSPEGGEERQEEGRLEVVVVEAEEVVVVERGLAGKLCCSRYTFLEKKENLSTVSFLQDLAIVLTYET
jgi:hypothetical protein